MSGDARAADKKPPNKQAANTSDRPAENPAAETREVVPAHLVRGLQDDAAKTAGAEGEVAKKGTLSPEQAHQQAGELLSKLSHGESVTKILDKIENHADRNKVLREMAADLVKKEEGGESIQKEMDQLKKDSPGFDPRKRGPEGFSTPSIFDGQTGKSVVKGSYKSDYDQIRDFMKEIHEKSTAPRSTSTGEQSKVEAAAQPKDAQKNKSAESASEAAPAAPLDGSRANGTLVWKDEKGLHQAQVTDGQIRDTNGAPIGTMDNTGKGSLNGQPLNISESDREIAFHGKGADRAQLDLQSKTEQKGFYGDLASPDGKEQLKVVSGNIFDKDDKFIGHLGADGKVSFESSQQPNKVEDVNTRFTDWKFKGSEGGKQREFETRADLTNGTMYIQEKEKEKEKENGKPVKYDVRMGMLIDSHGEQYGNINPPAMVNGALEGGSVTHAGRKIPLSDPMFKNAVFDLSPLGEGVRSGQHLKGVCTGAEEKLPDGHTKPGSAFVDLQKVYDQHKSSLKESEQKLHAANENAESLTRQLIPGLGAMDAVRAIGAQSQRDGTREQTAEAAHDINKMLHTGEVDAAVLNRLKESQKAAEPGRTEAPKESADKATKQAGSETPKLDLYRYDPAKIDQLHGAVRINDQFYDIEKGQLYRLGHSSTGPNPDQPVGALGPGYTVEFPGHEPISLADQNRVLMEFQVGNDPKVHRIVGLGHERTTANGEHIRGGLVDSEQMLSEAERAQNAAKAGREDYAGTRPSVTGALAESEHNPLGIGNRTGILDDMKRNLEDQTNLVKKGLDQLFTRGLREGKLDTENADRYIGATDRLMKDIGVTGTDARTLAEEGKQQQQQFKDTTKMAALTLLTAPASAWVAGAATAGRAAMAIRGLTTLAYGGAMSAALDQAHDTSLGQTARNFVAGAAETGVFMMGSPLSARLKEGASLLVKGGAVIGDSALSTVASGAVQRIRGDEHALELQNLLPSMGAMLVGHAVGAKAGESLKTELSQYIKNPKELERVVHTVQGTVNAGTFGAVSPVYNYTLSERQRLEAERGRPVSNAELLRDMNWSGLADTMATSGAMAALQVAGTSPLIHGFTGHAQRPIEERAEKLGGARPGGDPVAGAENEARLVEQRKGAASKVDEMVSLYNKQQAEGWLGSISRKLRGSETISLDQIHTELLKHQKKELTRCGFGKDVHELVTNKKLTMKEFDGNAGSMNLETGEIRIRAGAEMHKEHPEVFPEKTVSHETRHKVEALKRTALQIADPEGFRNALVEDVLHNVGRGGSRAENGTKLEQRTTATADEAKVMRQTLREYLKSGSTPRELGRNIDRNGLMSWMEKRGLKLPGNDEQGRHVKLLEDMVGEIRHAHYAMESSTFNEAMLRGSGNEAESRIVNEEANRLRQLKGTGTLEDHPEMKLAMRNASHDATAQHKQAAVHDYLFSVDEVKARRQQHSANLRTLADGIKEELAGGPPEATNLIKNVTVSEDAPQLLKDDAKYHQAFNHEQVSKYLPELEKTDPARAARIRDKLAQMEHFKQEIQVNNAIQQVQKNVGELRDFDDPHTRTKAEARKVHEEKIDPASGKSSPPGHAGGEINDSREQAQIRLDKSVQKLLTSMPSEKAGNENIGLVVSQLIGRGITTPENMMKLAPPDKTASLAIELHRLDPIKYSPDAILKMTPPDRYQSVAQAMLDHGSVPFAGRMDVFLPKDLLDKTLNASVGEAAAAILAGTRNKMDLPLLINAAEGSGKLNELIRQGSDRGLFTKQQLAQVMQGELSPTQRATIENFLKSRPAEPASSAESPLQESRQEQQPHHEAVRSDRTTTEAKLDVRQRELQEGPIRIVERRDDTQPGKRIYNAELTRADGSVKDVIVHTPDAGVEDRPLTPRLRKEMAFHEFNKEHFDHGYPATAPMGTNQEITRDGQSVKGWIQEKWGEKFDDKIRELAKQGYGSAEGKNIVEMMEHNPQLAGAIEQAFVERLMVGDSDNHSGNFLIRHDGEKWIVRSCDPEQAFNCQNAPSWDLSPANGVNTILHRYFSERGLSPGVLQKVAAMPTTPEAYAHLGLRPEEAKALANRVAWFQQHKSFPVAKPFNAEVRRMPKQQVVGRPSPAAAEPALPETRPGANEPPLPETR